ncbi:hypothetical protein EKA99_04500 [Streptococcus pseudopneumoniae]|nr:hypothetical protein [Streptococcus pseudopneumoniae]
MAGGFLVFLYEKNWLEAIRKNESDDSLFLKSRNSFPERIIQSFADWSLHRDSSRLGHTPARLND